ncbi:MAG: hypothetical protein ACOCX9_07830 [Spirochaetota bacterium]
MEKKSKLQERYELIRKGEHTEQSNKRRRSSRIFLIVDIVLIIIILLYITRPDSETLYKSTSLKVGNAGYRFSLLREDAESDLIATISVDAEEKTAIRQGPPLGTIQIFHKDTPWYQGEIGEEVQTLVFEKGQNRSFTHQVSGRYLQSYALKYPSTVITESERLFSPKKSYVPLKAVFSLNTDEKISSSIDFTLEVE